VKLTRIIRFFYSQYFGGWPKIRVNEVRRRNVWPSRYQSAITAAFAVITV